MTKPDALVSDVASRIRSHFESEGTGDIVRRSEELILHPEAGESEIELVGAEGPSLVHPWPKRVPLDAYLASALSQLQAVEKELVVHLSDIVSLVCREVDINLYEPRKKTDPVHHANVADSDV